MKQPTDSPAPEDFGLPKAPANRLEEGLQLTEYLKHSLQTVRVAFLQVGMLLDQVREKKLFAAMGHADLESYALDRLRLGRASLYRYMQVYNWVLAHHPEWIQPSPGTVIPDLSDIADMIRIDKKLEDPGLEQGQRATLEGLRKKAHEGNLRKKDLTAAQKASDDASEDWAQILARLREDRQSIASLQHVPAEVLSHLDAAIDIFANAAPLAQAWLHDEPENKAK